MLRLKIILTTILCLISLRSFAIVEIPSGMSAAEREEALRLVGFGTSSKILSDPYPLGGYAGFEAGFSLEFLPIDDLNQFGAGINTAKSEAILPKLTIGKGVYNDVDFFFHFTPFNRDGDVSQYGGILRWGFYQGTYLPLSASILGHMNSASVGSQMTSRAYGIDVVGGVDVQHLALFAGFGGLEASGNFSDGTGMKTAFTTGFHSFFGATVSFSKVFLTVQMDRYDSPVFSGKIGVKL